MKPSTDISLINAVVFVYFGGNCLKMELHYQGSSESESQHFIILYKTKKFIIIDHEIDCDKRDWR